MLWSGEPLRRGPDRVGLAVNIHVAHWPWAVCLRILDLGHMFWAREYTCNSYPRIRNSFCRDFGIREFKIVLETNRPYHTLARICQLLDLRFAYLWK